MFKGGGTDAGSAHLENGGIPAVVLGIPLRYCHDPYSLVHKNDLEVMCQLIKTLAGYLNKDNVTEIKKF